MKVSWPHTDEYATLYESAEWQQVSCGSTDRRANQRLTEIPGTSPALGACFADGAPSESGTVGIAIPPAGIQIREDKLAGARSLVSAAIVFVVFWGVVFWLLGAWGKVARYF